MSLDNCHCPDACCTDSASDMMIGEQMPVTIDVSEWMESVSSRTIADAIWTAAPVNGGSGVCPLVVSHPNIDNGNMIISARLSDGEPGIKYRVDVMVETCEMHRGRYCFTQYIRDC